MITNYNLDPFRKRGVFNSESLIEPNKINDHEPFKRFHLIKFYYIW